MTERLALPGLEDPLERVRREADKVLERFGEIPDVRAPIYIPSRHRADLTTTVALLDESGLMFNLVVEPHDAAAYAERYGTGRVLTLPNDERGVGYAREWIRTHAEKRGATYHWQLDDNVTKFYVRPRGSSRPEQTTVRAALAYAETLVSLMENVGGLTFPMHAFAFTHVTGPTSVIANIPLQCVALYRSAGDTSARFRSGTGEDWDYALQLLSEGWSTVQATRVSVLKVRKGSVPGGCWDSDYANGNRVLQLQQLQRDWPQAAFRILDGPERPVPVLAPSRIWRSFPQRPVWREA